MASLGITAANQDLHHPACDFARSMMLATLAETGVWLVDGATNLLPFPPEVHQAWKLHYDNIRHSLYNGFYQSWDLHPAQIPARLVAVYNVFPGRVCRRRRRGCAISGINPNKRRAWAQSLTMRPPGGAGKLSSRERCVAERS